MVWLASWLAKDRCITTYVAAVVVSLNQRKTFNPFYFHSIFCIILFFFLLLVILVHVVSVGVGVSVGS